MFSGISSFEILKSINALNEKKHIREIKTKFRKSSQDRISKLVVFLNTIKVMQKRNRRKTKLIQAKVTLEMNQEW